MNEIIIIKKIKNPKLLMKLLNRAGKKKNGEAKEKKK